MARQHWGNKPITRADDLLRFEQWLFGARPQVIASVSVETACTMYERLDSRLVEAKLLARQDALRRQAEGSHAG